MLSNYGKIFAEYLFLKKFRSNKFKKPLTYASWSSSPDISLAIKNEPYNSEGIDSDIDIKMFTN